MTQTTYSKYDYCAAKRFLRDATIERGFTTPERSQTLYRLPDGSLWQENESHLEPPEDDYSLTQIKPAPVAQESN